MPTVLFSSVLRPTTKKVSMLLAVVVERRTEKTMTRTKLVDKKTNGWLRQITKLNCANAAGIKKFTCMVKTSKMKRHDHVIRITDWSLAKQ
ncbi:unnamed protein product [Toxocara canis]|uniref:Secreted protein n=1 Tax=Toxocara canis TaxID=6265 RepID=A0A183V5B8_TOXCA|nr:unnamed protein product [Toxocara canis]